MLTNIIVVSLYMLRTPLKINELWNDFKKIIFSSFVSPTIRYQEPLLV